jgi:hypothetical protein
LKNSVIPKAFAVPTSKFNHQPEKFNGSNHRITEYKEKETKATIPFSAFSGLVSTPII